jgi:hypothetical protein
MIGLHTRAYAAAALPGGKTLVALYVRDKEQTLTLLARYLASGQIDTTFGAGGLVVVELGELAYPDALAVRDDGAIAITSCPEERASAPVTLLSADGTPNKAFSGDGKTELLIGGSTCLSDAVFSQGRLIAGGSAWNDRQYALALAAYDTGGGPDGGCCAERELAFADGDAARVAENAGSATLSVRLSQTSAQTVTVRYAATGGTAANGADYTLAAGALTFAPGQTSQRITVTLNNDDAGEGDETVVVALGSPSNAVLGDAATLTLAIADDEAPAPPTPGPPLTPTPPTPAPGNRIFLPLMWR